MKDLVNKSYYNWSVKDGDYDVYMEAHEKKVADARKRKIRNFTIFSFIISIVTFVAFYFYSKGI